MRRLHLFHVLLSHSVLLLSMALTGCSNSPSCEESVSSLEARLSEADMAWNKMDWWYRESVLTLTKGMRTGTLDSSEVGAKIRNLRARAPELAEWESNLKDALAGCGPELLRVRGEIDMQTAKGAVPLDEATALGDRLKKCASQMVLLATLGDSTAATRAKIASAVEQCSLLTTGLQTRDRAQQAIAAMQDAVLATKAPESWRKQIQ